MKAGCVFLVVFAAASGEAFLQPRPHEIRKENLRSWIDDLIPDMFKGDTEDDDFVKLEKSEEHFGPGPLMILYKIPAGIADDEVMDIIDDGAPALKNKCILYRICNDSNPALDFSLSEAVNKIAKKKLLSSSADDGSSDGLAHFSETPVLLFSGFSNSEMMATYNILGQEIYKETGGQSNPACAKVVPNAMEKTVRRVLGEIAGDHQDAVLNAS